MWAKVVVVNIPPCFWTWKKKRKSILITKFTRLHVWEMLRARCVWAPTTPAHFGGCMSIVIHVTAQTRPLLWRSAHQEQAGLGSQTSTSRSTAGQSMHRSAPGGEGWAPGRSRQQGRWWAQEKLGDAQVFQNRDASAREAPGESLKKVYVTSHNLIWVQLRQVEAKGYFFLQ